MKNILVFIALLAVPYLMLAQLPLPCYEANLNYGNNITDYTAIQNLNGTKFANHLTLNSGPGNGSNELFDDNYRGFVVNEAQINQEFSAIPDAIYGINGETPPENQSGEFQIQLCNLPQELEGAWFEPINYFPQLYEKIEWGVKLPENVEMAIQNWIDNDQDGTSLTPALNPFDPDQIDVTAFVTYLKDGQQIEQPVYGFFYREYKRMTSISHPEIPLLADVNEWNWQEHETAFRFRIRWAAEVVTQHAVRITVNVPGMGYWELTPFAFDTYWGDPRNSFIDVTENGHYFKTVDGHVYFPVGLNINEGTFGCNCMEGVSDTADCETCYEWGLDDPCCGISPNKRKRHSMDGTTLSEYTLATAAYEKLDRILEHLSEVAGGNAFRTLFDPLSFDIEFEKLNNYYDRQYQAWEFDHVLNKCHDLNLRIQWDMQIHYTITHHSHGDDRFDWDNHYNCTPCGTDQVSTGTNGWCYWNSCSDMGGPVDFLTNACAIANYKKKLRYMIARWGYSRNIFLMELMSEMNNIGGGDLTVVDDVNENGVAETWVHVDALGNELPPEIAIQIQLPKPYDIDAINTRPKVAWWHNEMARYIKEDLHHTRHLIAADYAGTAPMLTDFNHDDDCSDEEIYEICNPCQSSYFDDSWHSQFIDVVSFSNYNDGFHRWEKMAVQEYRKEDGLTDGLLCGWDDPSKTDDNEGWHSPLNSYESIWKPVVHAEEGYTPCMKDDYTGFVKDLLAGTFSGHASSGMSWDESTNTEHWGTMGVVLGFLNEHVLNDVNIGGGSWVADHSFSAIGALTQNNCKFAEAIYLRYQFNDNPKFTGVILNRSWNHHTMCNCDDEGDETAFTGENEPLSSPTEFGWLTDKIYLKNAGLHQYTIRYFDPFTHQQINQVNNWSGALGLGLEDYPTLGNGSDNHQPYYFFEAFLEGSEFHESPTIADDTSYIYSDKVKGTETSVANITTRTTEIPRSPTFQVYPSPGGNYPTLESDSKMLGQEAIICTCEGVIIKHIAIENTMQILDFSNFADGPYFITCPKFSAKTLFIKTSID